MKQIINKHYAPLWQDNSRYTIIMGGRAAGRSYAASQYALSKLVAPEYFRCAIMRYVLSDIRNSIYQEIRDRIEEQEIEDAINITENRLSFSYGQNTINGIGFRKSSGDQKSKLKSLANYNCVIIEEADEVNEEDFQQLDDSLRTLKSDIKIILLCNPPPKNHWIVKRWFNLTEAPVEGFFIPTLRSDQTDAKFIYTNYKNNARNLNRSTVENFERYKQTRPDHYYNMIEGLISEGNRGRIFKNWQPIPLEEYNKLEYPKIYGLDFGFDNDPTALYEVKLHNQKVYTKELIYQTGMRNSAIVETLEQFGVSKNDFIYADHNEGKTIDELRNQYGYNVVKATKGDGSIMAGINMLLEREVYYTEDSLGIAEEVQNYVWKIDRATKEPTNTPVDEFNHACFVAGTLVGKTPIEKIGVCTGVKKVYEYEIAGQKITATPDHPVLTHRGFTPIDTVRYNDVVWKQKLLYTTALGGVDSRSLINGLTKVTTVALRRIVEAYQQDYIDISGGKLTGKYLKSLSFITLTATLSIMTLVIWSVFTVVNTLKVMLQKKSESGLEKISKKLFKKQRNGQKPQKDKKEEKRWVKQMKNILESTRKKTPQPESAIYAIKNTKHLSQNAPDGVITIANKKRYVGQEPVYALATRSGMYQANGVMVSNCDALRYAVFSDAQKTPLAFA